MKLLIVNDEKLTAETMKRYIAWENYGISQVYTAYDAEAGKCALKSIQLILCFVISRCLVKMDWLCSAG